MNTLEIKKLSVKKGFLLLILLSGLTVFAQLPDLVVTEISWEPDPIKAGNAVLYTATIQNIGDGPTPGGVIVGVKFQADGTTFGWNDKFTNSLQPGESIVLAITGGPVADLEGLWIPENPGTYTISAEVDDYCMAGAVEGESSYCTQNSDPSCKNRICESNEENNKIYVDVDVTGEFKYEKLPDLIVTDFSWDPENPAPGDDVFFSATITNIGDTASKSTNGLISMVVYLDDTKIVRTKTTNDSEDLKAGETVTITTNHSYDASGGTDGSWIAKAGANIITVEVDDKANVEEHVESNNRFAKTLYINTEPSERLADLAVTNISFYPQNPVPGEMVTLKADVTNIGPVVTEPAPDKTGEIRVAFSIDGGRISRTIGNQIVKEPMLPGDVITFTGNFRDTPEWKNVDGKYSSNNPAMIIITAEVDYENRILESNTANNKFSKQITFFPMTKSDSTSLPDLIVSDINWTEEDDSLIFTADIKNTGNGATPSDKTFKVFFEVFDTLVVGFNEGSIGVNESSTVVATHKFKKPESLGGKITVTADLVGKWFEVPELTKSNNKVTYDLATGEISGIDPLISSSELSVYPNPANEVFFIKYKLEQTTDMMYSLIDVTGKTILKADKSHLSGNGIISINTGNITSGLYFLHIQNQNQHTIYKLIIQPK